MCNKCGTSTLSIRFNHPRIPISNNCRNNCYAPLFNGPAVVGPYHKSCCTIKKPRNCCFRRKNCHKIEPVCAYPVPCNVPCRPICYPPRCEPYFTESIYWY